MPAALICVAAILTGAAPVRAATVTLPFLFTGAAQTWTVPAGLNTATFTLIGAAGGAGGGVAPHAAGGPGAIVQASVAVTAGERFGIFVGGPGGANGSELGGFNGGGGTSTSGAAAGVAGGGGGASDVRTGAMGLADRLLIAGGGGGAGGDGLGVTPSSGGAGGPAGAGGTAGANDLTTATGGGGGGSGSAGAGGPGGAAGAGLGATVGSGGQSGTLGQGGGPVLHAGSGGHSGGGGGGYYGGGSGGSGASAIALSGAGGGGGGGGSSLFPSTGRVLANSIGAPAAVLVTYTLLTACPGDSAATAFGKSVAIVFSCTGNSLKYALVPKHGPAHGKLGKLSGRRIRYTPAAGFSGSDGFQVQATDADGHTAIDTVSVKVAALAVSCSGRTVVLLDARQSGKRVALSGFALPTAAGQTATITASGAKKVGTAKVRADGSFKASFAAPSAKLAAKVRYTATVAGKHSAALALIRPLVVSAAKATAKGLQVTIRYTGKGDAKGRKASISQRSGCKSVKKFTSKKFDAKGTIKVLLPAAKAPATIAYYGVRSSLTGDFTLPIAVPGAG